MKKTHVLILIDLQNDFVTGSMGSEEAKRILPHIRKKIEAFNGPIFLTKDTHGQNYLETAEGRNLPVLHCIARTPGHDLVPEIHQALSQKEYTVIEKNTFGSLQLINELNQKKEIIDSIEIMGLVTDICVISNALLLKAALPEVELTVDSAGCAGTSPANHTAALEVMKSCQIQIL